MVLLFRADTWVLSTSMKKRLVGAHTGFLFQVKGKWANRSSDGTCQKKGSESALKAMGNQDVSVYT